MIDRLRPLSTHRTAMADGEGRGREAAAQFAAVLYAAAFAPVAKALGFYGDVAVGSVATSLARNERGGLTDRLEAAVAADAAEGSR
jgi:hypothetical protein